MFVGDDWYLSDSWQEYEREFSEASIDIVYFPRTVGISSTKIGIALDTVHALDEIEN